jgi:hypothetical protein
MRLRLLITVAGAWALGMWLVPAAAASELIGRSGQDVRLEVDAAGRALLTYRSTGTVRRVLAWGAINAIHPMEGRSQLEFRLDYSGGWGAFRKPLWKTFRNACGRYRGPPLAWLVTACTAPDGTHWAVQSWQRTLPNYGLPAAGMRAAWELRLSHWHGPLPELRVRFGWTYRRFQQIYGLYTYRGRPVHGFRSTQTGNPLDRYGRNVYVDTFASAYGPGWRRENSFLTHRGTGGFCYGFYPHEARPAGTGARYRATVIGPGVLPDVYWEAAAPSSYDPKLDRAANDHQRTLLAGDALCTPK